MHAKVRKYAAVCAGAALASFAIPFVAESPAYAEDAAVAATTAAPIATIVKQAGDNPRFPVYLVHSPSMNRDVGLQVIRAADTSVPRPTLYLLNGAGGGEDNATWSAQTDLAQFFADKNVNVVIPVGGKFSYYTDWKNDDPVLGRNMWTTFLTKELPPLVNQTLSTNGENAIAGISMAGGSALALAESAPGLYKSVGSFSGCAETSTPIGREYVKMVVETRGHANTDNLWGPVGDPAWVANDPVVNAEKLRGTTLYISSGTGIPGVHDTASDPRFKSGDELALVNQVVLGGLIESAANGCTQRLAARLKELNIPATFDFRKTGSHSWGYWQDDLHNAWPTIAASLGVK
ncbi:alpha/beta hydrolase family protein [Smaragdicoccus niigatensis]|nr:alpha/beta hydrolase family protein [Smaragdicoccus niigatensis]